MTPTLRDLIAGATPGPWSVKSTDEGRPYTKNWREITPGVVAASSYNTNRWGEPQEVPGVRISEANAELIARCSPATMLKVIEALESCQITPDWESRPVCSFNPEKVALALSALNSTPQNEN